MGMKYGELYFQKEIAHLYSRRIQWFPIETDRVSELCIFIDKR